MRTRPAHPELLLWHAAGALDPEQAAAVARHLEQCSECRHESEVLESLGGTLRIAGGTGHVAAEDLVRYEEGSPARDPARGAIERHLAGCADCRADLDALARARPPATHAATTRPGPRLRRAWAVAAAAAVVIMAALITPRLWPVREGDRGITFTPPRRGAADERVLKAGGPWQALVLLPFDAPAGIYRVRVEGEEGAAPGGAAPGGAANGTAMDWVQADRDLRLRVTIAPLSSPGVYRLIATPQAPDDSSPYIYSFRVVPAAPVAERSSGP